MPQTRLDEAQSATARAAMLEQDNAELAGRLVEMKEGEIERMNEMNRMREEMVGDLDFLVTQACCRGAMMGCLLS